LYLIKADKTDNKLISYRLRFIEITAKLYIIAVRALRDKIITIIRAPNFLPPQAEENRAIEQSTIEQIDKEKFNCSIVQIYFSAQRYFL